MTLSQELLKQLSCGILCARILCYADSSKEATHLRKVAAKDYSKHAKILVEISSL